MQISSRFSMALHILLLVDVFRDSHKVTSDFIAGSVRTNPVVIRKIMLQLRDAGLIQIAQGTGGIAFRRPVEELTMLDIYYAVEPNKDGKLFKIHPDPEPRCPVGGHIEHLLTPHFLEAQQALENQLSQKSLRGLLDGLHQLWDEKAASAPGAAIANRP
jgi:DNA-binding IscR family transcriptional regulator